MLKVTEIVKKSIQRDMTQLISDLLTLSILKKKQVAGANIMTSFTLGAAMAVIQACLKVKPIHLWSKVFTNMFMSPVKLNLSATKLAAAYVACR